MTATLVMIPFFLPSSPLSLVETDANAEMEGQKPSSLSLNLVMLEARTTSRRELAAPIAPSQGVEMESKIGMKNVILGQSQRKQLLFAELGASPRNVVMESKILAKSVMTAIVRSLMDALDCASWNVEMAVLILLWKNAILERRVSSLSL